MYAFSTLTAASLLFAAVVGVYSQELIGEVLDFEVNARDILESPLNYFVDPDVALNFIDRLCGQPDDQMHGLGAVSGAFNTLTKEFKTWSHYRYTEGANHNSGSYWATGEWNTFWGYCSLKTRSTWVQRGPRSEGEWTENRKDGPPEERERRNSKVNIQIPGFWATTNLRSWIARCSDSVDMAATFKRLLLAESLPRTVKEWIGLRDPYPTSPITKVRGIAVKNRHKGRVVTLTTVRVVHALQVFRVMGWYWHYSDDYYGTSDTWLGLGSEDWENIYTFLGYVNAYGANGQEPDPATANRRHWDPRITYSNQEEPLLPNE